MRSKTILLMILVLIWVCILGFIYLDSSQDKLTKAQKMINKFMIARLQNNQPEAETFLTEYARWQYSQPGITLLGGSNAHFVNYKIVEIIAEGAREHFRATFVIRIYEVSAYFDETVIISLLENTHLQIESVTRGEYVFL